MKNIHLLPTANYSPLVNSTNKYGGLFLSRHYFPMKDMGDSYQHIYITDDSEIKVGDWCIDKYNVVYKQETDKIFTEFTGSKKIILTTDQDLIKDGVQPIDNTFLEWFVNNPSCESVKIESWQTKGEWDLDYKIIIPQEEPKKQIIYSKEDLKQAYSQGWMTRERFDDLSPDIIYPDGLDYEEKQDYAFNLWFEQFRKK
jgi:hypothetical protein